MVARVAGVPENIFILSSCGVVMGCFSFQLNSVMETTQLTLTSLGKISCLVSYTHRVIQVAVLRSLALIPPLRFLSYLQHRPPNPSPKKVTQCTALYLLWITCFPQP